MKKILLLLVVFSFTLVGCFEQTALEKVDASKNDVHRSVKKGVNRLHEAACDKDDLKCLKEKVIHRTEEGTDFVKDKTKEATDKMN